MLWIAQTTNPESFSTAVWAAVIIMVTGAITAYWSFSVEEEAEDEAVAADDDSPQLENKSEDDDVEIERVTVTSSEVRIQLEDGTLEIMLRPSEEVRRPPPPPIMPEGPPPPRPGTDAEQ